MVNQGPKTELYGINKRCCHENILKNDRHKNNLIWDELRFQNVAKIDKEMVSENVKCPEVEILVGNKKFVALVDTNLPKPADNSWINMDVFQKVKSNSRHESILLIKKLVFYVLYVVKIFPMSINR